MNLVNHFSFQRKDEPHNTMFWCSTEPPVFEAVSPVEADLRFLKRDLLVFTEFFLGFFRVFSFFPFSLIFSWPDSVQPYYIWTPFITLFQHSQFQDEVVQKSKNIPPFTLYWLLKSHLISLADNECDRLYFNGIFCRNFY